MCGRYTLFLDPETLQEEFNLTAIPDDYQPRYNIAPSTPVLAVANRPEMRAEWMRWGLIPSWAKDPSIGNKLINARGETLLEKPSFRNAFQRRRCLILSNGFYEWKKGEGKEPSTPFFITRKDQRPFAFAGLWEFWKSPEAEEVLSCTIITTSPNELVAPIHNRMPVILPKESIPAWLSAGPADRLVDLLKPLPADQMTAWTVSRRVNIPDFDSPELVSMA